MDNQGKVTLNEKTIDYLMGIENNIKVVSVIGPYRTGKSFLLNRMNGK